MKLLLKRLLISSLLLITSIAHADIRQNQQFDLSEYQGKVVFLDFWASWCGPCLASFPWMAELQDEMRAAGLQVVSINLDANKNDAFRFLESQSPNFDIYFDGAGDLAKEYGVQAMPTSFLIDRTGKLVAEHKGFRLDDREPLKDEISKLLEQ